MAEPGLLDRARVYLSGPMYYGGEAHGESGWRARVTDFLEAHGATVFNPWQKPPVRGVGEFGREGDMGQPYRDRWTFDDSPDGAVARAYCREKARPMMHIDLRMIDTSDVVIAFCPTNIYSVGTVHEIVVARQQKKPVLFVTPPIELPALRALREHLADDDRGGELLAQLEAEGPLRTNPTGIPSSWYMAILDSENFFDGFGFAHVRDDFPQWHDNALDSLESTSPPERPLLPYLTAISAGATPYKWDSEGRKRRNDDWLLLD
ncbi:MAG TPA: nucleoside 2-deoxyribosyltransferase [Gaiellaceae bacterium]|jgi:nucleoside 2-deoxyribosyltransferase